VANDFVTAMRQAVQLTRASKVARATQTIKDAIANWTHAPAAARPSTNRSSTFAREKKTQAPTSSASGLRVGGMSVLQAFQPAQPETLDGLRAFGKTTRQPPPLPDGGQFLERSFTCSAGTRSYKLYVPAKCERPHGLIVMLHGCKQNPDDFAVGTNMNLVADPHGLLVAYPRQPCSANAASCWNWFDRGHQSRDAGEPAIIAGITQALMSEFGLERPNVYVAGLSAGGAMAAVMVETYPELYAAVGIHSGIAYGAADDLMSAYSAMRGATASSHGNGSRDPYRPRVRTIVFQGGVDHTVDRSNAARIVAAASGEITLGTEEILGRSAGGRTYTRKILSDAAGNALVEYWLIDGSGHAWAGGSPAGSYTDPQGPDASAEIVRFFRGPEKHY
jgi:poly(hydroxyalkanoate) depolymerase family esterase